MSQKWEELREWMTIPEVNFVPKDTVRELLDERDKLAREALMREGLISGLHADRKRLERVIEVLLRSLRSVDENDAGLFVAERILKGEGS